MSKDIKIEDVFKLVAGHSVYSGDSILSAFTCLSEGKDVKPIKPIYPERLHEKWKKIGEKYYNWSNHDTIRCIRCKFEKDIPSGCHMPNYCEFCGADMRGGSQ